MVSNSRLYIVALVVLLWLCPHALRAQDARTIVQRAVSAEQQAARTDHSLWKYMMSEDGGELYYVVDTKYGSLKRHIEEHGHPASSATLAADDAHNQRFINDPSLQAKAKRDSAHDDKSAEELLNEMPDAFLWKVESDNDNETALSYKPNPDYSPPDMQSRVMGAMSGTMVVDKKGYRIKTFKGHLVNDVTIGWGLLARIRAGGTFDVERRPTGEGVWQITETHVHINGHALFFHTISQQEDEVKYDFSRVPPDTTLEQAAEMLKEPPKENAKR